MEDKALIPLIFVLLGVVFVYYSTKSDQADAPGHCEANTEMQGQKYSYDEIMVFATNAGFGCDAPTAVAIALAESGGHTGAYNPETQDCTPIGEGSVGLWQIDRKWHPEFRCLDLNDPQINANCAYKTYINAGGFRPWSTYKNGSYEKYL